MPIISTIGRRSIRVRLLIWTIYGLLALGATTMIYPFLLMLAGSTKSSVDAPATDVIPPFLRSVLRGISCGGALRVIYAFSHVNCTFGGAAQAWAQAQEASGLGESGSSKPRTVALLLFLLQVGLSWDLQP